MININTKKTFIKFICLCLLSATVHAAQPFQLFPFNKAVSAVQAAAPAIEEELQIAVSEKKGQHTINFLDVPVVEFIRYVSKISQVNFIFDNKDLEFNITFTSGKPVSAVHVVKAMLKMLRARGFTIVEEDHCYLIHKRSEDDGMEEEFSTLDSPNTFKKVGQDKIDFSVYKLQYHQGAEIQEAVKKIAADLKAQSRTPQKLLNAIDTVQWVKATNSLLFSGDEETTVSLKKLISSLDIPLRQVFIEVLVIETDVKKNMEFGLQWAAGGKMQNGLGFGGGNFPPHHSHFAETIKSIDATHPPTGLNQIPLGGLFDFGVIGDIIMHKGHSYLSLGSLVSALQRDGDSTIVLNQKIITQDNKHSTIFVGDTIPFTGSVVQTIGQGQQTTANIDYRDIGVNLKITPMLGEDNIITLEIDEEITECVNDPMLPSNNAVNGIRATKTNMSTNVHVPDKHFLVLSGMIRNAKAHHKAGIPCLGSIPWFGALFSKTHREDEKRNVVIFVRPHIIHSVDDYKNLTQQQQALYQSQAAPDTFQDGINLVNP